MTGEEDIDGLGAEYVLGSLDPAERAQVEARRRDEPALDAAIEAWQRRLAPLNEREPGISPPDHVYDQVLARIAGQPSASVGSANVVPLRVLGGSGRWRTIAAGVTALAACLALALGWDPDAQFLVQFYQYQPSDAALARLWESLVRRPCEEALGRVYPVLKRQGRLDEVFRYQDLGALAVEGAR